MDRLVILTHVPSAPVLEGFVPAAGRLGLSVTLLTDRADAHRAYYANNETAVRPADIVPCNVFNPLEAINAVAATGATPRAIFSNSDHLQASTGIAANYFGLPAKDWRVAHRVKNKAEMRAWLAAKGIDSVKHTVVSDEAGLERAWQHVPGPCIVKPREGVASELVTFARSFAEFREVCRRVWNEKPGQPLIVEEYLDGPLCTLETWGDVNGIEVLGGFDVRLSPLPYFIEMEAIWKHRHDEQVQTRILEQLHVLGIRFGVCHTEFVVSSNGPRIIEVNYRSIGDYREFFMQELFDIDYFGEVLRLHLGEPKKRRPETKRAGAIRYVTAKRDGTLNEAPASFKRENDGVTLEYRASRSVGDAIRISHSNRDYLGVFRAIGPDDAAVAKALDDAERELTWLTVPS